MGAEPRRLELARGGEHVKGEYVAGRAARAWRRGVRSHLSAQSTQAFDLGVS